MKIKIINSDIYQKGKIFKENEIYNSEDLELEGLTNFYEPLDNNDKMIEENETPQPQKKRGRPPGTRKS